jgi:hypothetical protein
LNGKIKAMKRILPIIISIITGLSAGSQTIIPPGPVSGLWTYANSPYLITGETTVLDGTSLEIEPGVRVEWQDSYSMHVQGQLLAIGTESDSITFIAGKQDLGFRSIRFEDTPLTNDSSKFVY